MKNQDFEKSTQLPDFQRSGPFSRILALTCNQGQKLGVRQSTLDPKNPMSKKFAD